MGSLNGRNCVITGASRGLGAKIAHRFWLEGASLLLVARSGVALKDFASSLPAGEGQHAFVLECDLSIASTPELIASEAANRFGNIHVLLNNAAIQGPIGACWTCKEDEWEEAIRVNLMAPTALCRKLIPIMDGGQSRCKIINVSGGGATSARPNFSAYGTAKAGLARFSETLAVETSGMGIDVNCIAPGAMFTAMTDAILDAGPAAAGSREYQDAAKLRQEGVSRAKLAVELCHFLASSASDGLTGKLLSAVWDPWEQLPEHMGELDRTDIYTLRRIVPKDRGFDWGER